MSKELGASMLDLIEWVLGGIATVCAFVGKMVHLSWTKLSARVTAAEALLVTYGSAIAKIAAMESQVAECREDIERLKPIADEAIMANDDLQVVKTKVAVLENERESVDNRLETIAKTTHDTNQKVDNLITLLLDRNR